ncbi:hypothetical protein ACFYWN_42225 [Streptomyces sp. NPDC002917]|uniref:hypothetical protein n=1 Tax=unclassified Streptomyces TaxID=2593676 RepID=UPI002E800FC1|nr:hypothetical protein [Streptomyces sp. NBC_00562]WTC78095.1 hypothetical protein OH719_09625 [Streptomyces sp. NBC_01653]WTD92767.1 hypothetical protein OG891_37245 [Streptomyces sp. NBC_01637]WUC23832.1 hypothetical protein OHA33_36035 [Streptomyces sp. NBC_00562]
MARHPPLSSTTLHGTLSTAVLALSAGALGVSSAAAATGTITRLPGKRLDLTG